MIWLTFALTFFALATVVVFGSKVGDFNFSTSKLNRGLPGIVRIAGYRYLKIQDEIIRNLEGVEIPVEAQLATLRATREAVFKALMNINIQLTMHQNKFLEALDKKSKTIEVSFECLREHQPSFDSQSAVFVALSPLGPPETLKILIEEHMHAWMRRVVVLGDKTQHDLFTSPQDDIPSLVGMYVGYEASLLEEFFDALGDLYMDGRVRNIDNALFSPLNYLLNLCRYTRSQLLSDLDEVKRFGIVSESLMYRATRAFFQLRASIHTRTCAIEDALVKKQHTKTSTVQMKGWIDVAAFVASVKLLAQQEPEKTWPLEFQVFLKIAESKPKTAEMLRSLFVENYGAFAGAILKCSTYLEMMETYRKFDKGGHSIVLFEGCDVNQIFITYLTLLFRLWKIRLVLAIDNGTKLANHAPKVVAMIGRCGSGFVGNLLIEYVGIRADIYRLLLESDESREIIDGRFVARFRQELEEAVEWNNMLREFGGKVVLDRRLFVIESDTSLTRVLPRFNRFAFGPPIALEFLLSENPGNGAAFRQETYYAFAGLRRELFDMCRNAQFTVITCNHLPFIICRL